MKSEREMCCGELLHGEVHRDEKAVEATRGEIERILRKADLRELRMVLQFVKPLDK